MAEAGCVSMAVCRWDGESRNSRVMHVPWEVVVAMKRGNSVLLCFRYQVVCRAEEETSLIWFVWWVTRSAVVVSSGGPG